MLRQAKPNEAERADTGESVCKIDAVIPEMDFKDVSNLHEDPSLSISSSLLPYFERLALSFLFEGQGKIDHVKGPLSNIPL